MRPMSCTPARRAAQIAGAGLLAALLLPSVGCFNPEKARGQAEEDKDRVAGVDTIGDVIEVDNVLPLRVEGVGLVTGLGHTGSGAPPGELRKMLEDDLRKRQVPEPTKLLDSADTAMVIVTGFIPPGTRKGEVFDVRVTLPPGSKVSSLNGGYLQECYLRIWDTKLHINPNSRKPDGALSGHEVAKAGGPLVVGLTVERDQQPNWLVGDVWQGAHSFLDRPYHLVLADGKDKRNTAAVANAVAQRINSMFQDDPQRQAEVLKLKGLLLVDQITGQINSQTNQSVMGGRDTARAVNPKMVVVNVPWEYRHNSQRYILLVCKMPVGEKADQRQAYRQRLNTMLHDPAHTIRAAIRLEALGRESIPTLKTALKDEHPLVRFASAESLAYLGDGSGVAELGKLAEQHYQLRAYCLIALASLEQSASRAKLTELLSSPGAETRYGAFRALQLCDVKDGGIGGEVIGHSFYLHRIAPSSPSMIHYALNHRAEVVLFGQPAMLVPPFRLKVGSEFVVSAAPDDRVCTISRFQIDPVRKEHEQCTLRVDDVLRTLAAMGAGYPDVIELLRQVEDEQRVNAPVFVNAMPQPLNMDDLAQSGLDAKQWGLTPATTTAVPSGAPAHYVAAVPNP